ncbi:MAG: nodulation protein NfeD [Chloroflexota bacterium]
MRKTLWLAIWLGSLWLAGLVYAQNQAVVVLEATGPVTPAMAAYFERGIQKAERSGATAVVIILDTPGGQLETTLEIVKLFRAADTPIIVFVGPRGAQAASAGSVITLAAHAAGMAPETVIGAASPVEGSGADIEETLYRKVVEDMKATVRGLAERRGQEAVALAEAMIEEAKAVNSAEALEAGLIDVVAEDVDELLHQLDGLTVEVNGQERRLQTAGVSQTSLAMTVVERVLHSLSNPLLISVLLAIAAPAILIELSSPGGWVAGFIGVLSLGLALYGLGQLPANWFGLGLVAVAFVLFLLEVKAPTHGALATAGALTLLVGLLVLFNSPGTPEFARLSIPSAVAISLSTAAFFVFIVTMAVRAQKRPPITGQEALVGQVGRVRQPLAAPAAIGQVENVTYEGTVLVMGELWRATAGEPLAAEEQIVVEGVEGFTLKVRRK